MKTHRKKIYDELKKYGLTNKANELFGHNFTQVSSNKLEKLIKEYKANFIEAYENKEAEKRAAEAIWTHEPVHFSRWYEDMLEKLKEKGLIRNIDELRNFFKKSESASRKYDIQEILDRLDTIICLLRNKH